MRSLRTLQLSTARSWRGGENQLLLLSRGLVARNHHVLIVTNKGSVLSERAREWKIDVQPVLIRGEWDLRAAWRIARIIREEKIELIHMHDAHSLQVGAQAAWLSRTGCARVASRRVDFEIRSRFKYMKGADRVIAISEAVREGLVEKGLPESLIPVVHSGIDPTRVQNAPRVDIRTELDLDLEMPLLAAVGELTGHKGHRFLLEALPRVLSEFGKVFLLLIGAKADLEQDLKRRVADLGIDSSVRFLGFREDVSGILQSVDLFLFPSLSEGLGTSILEAMSVELPVVASRIGGIPEIVAHGETGLLVPPSDPPELAKAIIRMLREPEKARAMGVAGRARMEREFTDTKVVLKTEKIYDKVMSEMSKS